MVKTYRGYNRKFLVLDCVGCVPPSAESRFKHAHVAFLVEKRKHSDGGFYFKRSRIELAYAERVSQNALAFYALFYDGEILCNFLVRKRFAVYQPPFVVAENGRRIVSADAVARLFQNRREIRADRAFAVRTCDMHEFQVFVGRAEKVEKFAHTLDSVVRTRPFDILYVVDCLLIKQKAPPLEALAKNLLW